MKYKITIFMEADADKQQIKDGFRRFCEEAINTEAKIYVEEQGK